MASKTKSDILGTWKTACVHPNQSEGVTLQTSLNLSVQEPERRGPIQWAAGGAKTDVAEALFRYQ